MSSLLKIEYTPRGTLSKAEAIEYVGGPDFFKELESGHGLTPCRKKATRLLYRIAELDRCLTAAENALKFLANEKSAGTDASEKTL